MVMILEDTSSYLQCCAGVCYWWMAYRYDRRCGRAENGILGYYGGRGRKKLKIVLYDIILGKLPYSL